MATLDRQIPSVDTFLCEPWSFFVRAAKSRFVDSKFARRWRRRFDKLSGGLKGSAWSKKKKKLSVIELSKHPPPPAAAEPEPAEPQSTTTYY